LVCTFSSNVCRAAYELMQTRYLDGSWRFRSLDDDFFFWGQHDRIVMAIYDHDGDRERGEIDLKKGDLVVFQENRWNGFSKGKNIRTQQIGFYPSFKVKDMVRSV
jgi:glycoprotein 6-alpha-L-fucosyltransferase